MSLLPLYVDNQFGIIRRGCSFPPEKAGRHSTATLSPPPTRFCEFRGPDMTYITIPPEGRDLLTGRLNGSIPEDCLPVRFSEWEYLPWNNSDNIVSLEVSAFTSKVRCNLLQLLFLIGGPANVLNMVVFYKQGLGDRVNLLLFSLSLADELGLIAGMLNYVEDFYLQFTGGPKPGVLYSFVMNNHLGVLHSFCYVSFVLSAIVAVERCCCVLAPLTYQSLMRTRTLAAVIVAVYVVIPGLFLVVIFRYTISCVYNPDASGGVVFKMFTHSEFYQRHKALIDYTDSVVFGAGLPTVVAMVVTTATVLTVSTLRKAAAWRTETASSSLSAKDVALTKMLIGTSVLLVVCVVPSCLFRVACLFVPHMNTGGRYENFYVACVRISLTFMYINCTFNIFIYYVMGTRYRETLSALFKKRKARPKEMNM